MLRPHFFVHCRAPHWRAVCFGEGQTAASSPWAAQKAQAIRASSNAPCCRCALLIACNSPASSACHVFHGHVQAAVQAAVSATRWCYARAPRCVDDAQAISSFNRATAIAHDTCALPAAVVGTGRRQRCNQATHRDGQTNAAVQRHCTQCSCIRLRCALRHRAVMDRATRLKRAQKVRCVRATRARSNTRTACHCTAWPIDPS